MVDARAPIGVFDSGVGGLTVLSELLRELPGERFVYFGDTANCPYGVRPEVEVQELAANAARFLLARGAKIIVVACNAASVSARETLRAAFAVPFVVVVPAVKPAAARTRTGCIGIAATEVSARSHYLRSLIDEHANGVRVLAVGCPRLVELAEAGHLSGAETEAAVREYVAPLAAAGIDTLVLGCTHFPAMRAVFEQVVGPGVAVIDSGAAIARRTRAVLSERHDVGDAQGPLVAPRPPDLRDEFWCSGDPTHFAAVASAILGAPIVARHAPSMERAPRASGRAGTAHTTS
jgi:glutamate racemase